MEVYHCRSRPCVRGETGWFSERGLQLQPARTSARGHRQSEGEAPRARRRVGGLLRLFLYALAGAAVGAILGFVGVNYLEWYKDQAELFISSMAGGGALLFGLMHLLHYDV